MYNEHIASIPDEKIKRNSPIYSTRKKNTWKNSQNNSGH